MMCQLINTLDFLLLILETPMLDKNLEVMNFIGFTAIVFICS